MGETFHKILVIDLAYIGDLLMATPAISEIKKHYPGTPISVLCSPNSKAILERNPAVGEILTFDIKTAGFLGRFRIGRRLRREGFDIVFVFHRAFGSALIAYLAGIRRRVGFSTEGRGWLLTHPVPLDMGKHRSENDLAVLQAYGLEVNFDSPAVFVTDPSDERFPEKVLGAETVERGYVVFNPNGSWETKRWPVERFKELAGLIKDEFGLMPVGIGAAGEFDRVEDALGGRGVNLAGHTDLSKLGVLCRKAELVVTNDSGPMHIAAAIGAKVIALFGPTSPARCGPRSSSATVVRRKDLECIGCYKKKCPVDFPCMNGIQVEEIFGIVKETLTNSYAGSK